MMKEILKEKGGRILLLVLDGLGGVEHPDYEYKTELEFAYTPNLDKLAKESLVGLMIPVDYGITPGSGPAHLGLFGYDPIKNEIKRGVLEAYGIGLTLKEGDIAIRGNFATIDEDGRIVDRRAGRISTDECKRLVQKLNEGIKEINGVEIILKHAKEHRFVIVFSPKSEELSLSDNVTDTDPQMEGLKPLDPIANDQYSVETAKIAKEFVSKAKEILKDEPKANFVLLRGFSSLPSLEPFPKKYRLKALALSYYPMYRGITKLLGFDTPMDLESFEICIQHLKENYQNYDFVYLHFKETDKAGEDGNFVKKIELIEYVDEKLPEILKIPFDVVCVTGDHSTPSLYKSHWWYPVPVLIHSKIRKISQVEKFCEKECLKGQLGIFPSKKLLSVILAESERLKKFGA